MDPEGRIRHPPSVSVRPQHFQSITSTLARASCDPFSYQYTSLIPFYSTTVTMVKLTEVEDEHFSQEKPMPSKHNVLLTSDDEEEDDYTDTG